MADTTRPRQPSALHPGTGQRRCKAAACPPSPTQTHPDHLTDASPQTGCPWARAQPCGWWSMHGQLRGEKLQEMHTSVREPHAAPAAQSCCLHEKVFTEKPRSAVPLAVMPFAFTAPQPKGQGKTRGKCEPRRGRTHRRVPTACSRKAREQRHKAELQEGFDHAVLLPNPSCASPHLQPPATPQQG